MLHALITFAAETVEAEPSKTPFYVAGGLLACWAVVIAAIGMSRHRDFPGSAVAARGVMGISAVLVAAAMATAVVTG
jgi:hypothetical protein